MSAIEDPARVAATSLAGSLGTGTADLVELFRRLHGARTMSELFADACAGAIEWCGFSRALVLAVEDQRLDATVVGSLEDPASEALRSMLPYPLRVPSGSAEEQIIRQAESGRHAPACAPSVLQEVLGLEQFSLGVIMPEHRVLALLLLDRSGPSVDDDDRAAVHLFSSMLAFAVERLFLRVRMTEFSAELRYLTASALGMIKEASDSPVALPRDLGPGIGTTLVFPAAFPASPPSERLRELFSARERQIAEKLAAGCSNREIAEDLHLSTNTVKGHVARVLRKLGASNRAGAVSRYMELRDG